MQLMGSKQLNQLILLIKQIQLLDIQIIHMIFQRQQQIMLYIHH
jgi:hypothetical protein